MATHKPGNATENASVNLLEQEKLIFARIAVAQDRSLGDVIRRLAVEGLRQTDPGSAEEITQLRQSHREQLILHLGQ